MNHKFGASPTDELIDDIRRDLDIGLIAPAVFSDPDLYQAELRRIFTRTWVFLGHESEIPNRGDFVQRNIGEDPFIVIRDDNGDVRVLLNACRHRGATVCRVQAGNARMFVCPYHGWTYTNSGELSGVPVRNLGYAKLKLSDWGLYAAPNVAVYSGLIFANLDKDAPSFEEYVGDYAWYLDINFHLSEGGMEVLGEPHRWLVDANWKQGAENFCGDSAHTQMTHRSALQIGVADLSSAGAPKPDAGVHVHDISGHAVSIRRRPGEKPFFSYPPEVKRHFRPGALNEQQFALAEESLLHNGTLFPNFSFLHIGLSEESGKEAAGFLTVRLWMPKGPRQTEIVSWILAPKEASEEYKRRAYRIGMSSFSPSGNFEQDDVSVWPGGARTGGSIFAAMNHMRYNYQMGLGDMSPLPPKEIWDGPGIADSSNAGEGGLRSFHKTWLKWMKGSGRNVADPSN